MFFCRVYFEASGHPIKGLFSNITDEARGFQLLCCGFLLVTQFTKSVDDQT